MGASAALLVHADIDARTALRAAAAPDRDAAARLARRLFPREPLRPRGDATLAQAFPRGGDIHVGCFPGVWIAAARTFAIDRPSRLPARFLEAGRGGTLTLFAMISVVDWFAYARWVEGRLVRALSIGDGRIIEDQGERMPFEEPWWAGQHPLYDEEEGGTYPHPFHPLELGEATLGTLLGCQLEGPDMEGMTDPARIVLARHRRPLWGRCLAPLLRAV